jgi:hypothetical protein
VTASPPRLGRRAALAPVETGRGTGYGWKIVGSAKARG